MKSRPDWNWFGCGGDLKCVGWGRVRALIAFSIVFTLLPKVVYAVFPPGNTNLSNTLGRWSFNDTTGWTNDFGFAPISFTNLGSSILGNGSCLVLDSTNAAWVQYHVTEEDC